MQKVKSKINIFLLKPRGFCAGVIRAISIVDGAIQNFNQKIYVKHEIVHNKFVVDGFKNRGVEFIEDVNSIPDGSTLIFSAHGVSQDVEDQALKKNINCIDATCPLVKKIHRNAIKYSELGYNILFIGHKGHPEVEGTMGRVNGNIILIETVQDIDGIKLENKNPIVYITQTTLSIDDTKEIIEAIKLKFPNIIDQSSSDICYATQNRQDAVKSMKGMIDFLIVIGSQYSSNSNQLVKTGMSIGVDSVLIESAKDLNYNAFFDGCRIGITCGASSPEILVSQVIEALSEKFDASIQEYGEIKEDITFHVPKEVRI
jgi:4-hydroxy-3-methylbut-2-enyl diphosphate reductase